jgi:putative DNA primase/helicase
MNVNSLTFDFDSQAAEPQEWLRFLNSIWPEDEESQQTLQDMMMSNELPDMRDASGALAKRYVVLTLTKSWLGQEDTSLSARLRAELPGILLWALQGLARLLQRGKFLQPTSSAQTIEELEAMTSPIKAFVAERCEFKSQAKVTVAALFDAWRSWCASTGYPHAGNVQSFGKNLRAAFPEIETTRPQEDLTRERCYKGVALTSITTPSADVRGQTWERYD